MLSVKMSLTTRYTSTDKLSYEAQDPKVNPPKAAHQDLVSKFSIGKRGWECNSLSTLFKPLMGVRSK